MAEGDNGGVNTLRVQSRTGSEFHFTSMKRGESFYRLELSATHIDRPLPKHVLAFPDVERLEMELEVVDLERTKLPTFLVLLKDGRAWMAKMALAFGPDMQASAKTGMPDADWDELRGRDASLGA